MYAKVIIDTNSRFLDRAFTYEIPQRLEGRLSLAMRVLVPFGKSDKPHVGFVYDLVDEIDGDYKTKEIIGLIDEEKLISKELLDLAFFMSKRYLSPIQAAIRQVLPPGKIKDIKVYFQNISKESSELLDFLNKKRSLEEIKEAFPSYKDELAKLLEEGLVKKSYDVKKTDHITYQEFVKLVDKDRGKIKSNAKNQLAIFDYLKDKDWVPVKEVMTSTKAPKSTIKALVDKNLLAIRKKEVNKEIEKIKYNYGKFVLNEDQDKALGQIKKDRAGHFLLYGVTGSGKTEIFLQMVEEVISEGKEAIILVPEISLTPQTIERFKGRFKEKIAVIHSRLTPKERFDQWRMIKNGEVKIAIGARSAIFAPFNNLGLIVIDEEHDQSYISGQDPKYHTDEIAAFRANYHSCNLILASATPSLNSLDKMLNKKYKLIKLNSRINKTTPDIDIVDMREELKKSNYSMLSLKLQEELRKNLRNGQQSILFLNKVGHDSFTFCRSCGYVVKCDACDVAMTYHKNVDRLVCHYCGRTKKQPKICPVCHSTKIKEFGAGTEKLEEEVRALFPEARVMRMDSMTANSKKSYYKMYEMMKNGQIDILLGTQMIAKGLDFKNVSLVGIVAADLSLNVGDFKANETTFELLTQVSGRAGRGDIKGRVIIQTYKAENFVIQAAKNNDYKAFSERELQIRKAFSYPPYTNIISIKIINEDRHKTSAIAKELFDDINKLTLDMDEVSISGPNPCKISRINNKYRYNILIKAEDKDLKFISKLVEDLRMDYINKYKDTSIIPALNPVNIN
ncbi:primosomal protein N' [Anaerococcus sp. AGMB09787]|uniref:primosomal protein N' n=1 Tax=Anaerococcus sp. AGMB09787 TaxID=2922869 RepID=UPI001FAF6838|nr:primosomal protein N' [Anaerococcus sp. AGMB09787]